LKSKTNNSSICKSNVFLGHKTIKIDKNNKHRHKHKQINSYSPKTKISFVGKKRINYMGIKTIKENSLILYCLNCAWKFPDKMPALRRNHHVYKCFEGNGKLDIMKYNEEQKLKSLRKYSYKKIVKLVKCPICGKNLEGEKPKTKKTHLYDCSRISII